jgi:CSLREA domain-containing protein
MKRMYTGGALALLLLAGCQDRELPTAISPDRPNFQLQPPQQSGTLVAWGSDEWGQVSNTPAGSGFVAADAGSFHVVALRSDGTLASWGYDTYDQVITNMPTGSGFVAVAAGSYHSVALRSDGTLVSWGANIPYLVAHTPTGSGYVAIAAGGLGGVALRSDGTLASWGYDGNGRVSNTPTGNGFIAVAAGSQLNVALRSDGTLVSWGFDHYGQVSKTPTSSGLVAVAAGEGHSVALRTDGTLVSWGNELSDAVINTPTEGGFVAVAAGGGHSVALRTDGTLVSWGNDHFGQVSTTPAGGGFLTVSVGARQTVAILSPEPRSWVVNNTSDPGNGVCTPPECTLREAIKAARSGDTIRFDLPGPGPHTISLSSLLDINTGLTINGPETERVVLHAPAGIHIGVVPVQSGPPPEVTIRNLTITGATGTGPADAALRLDASAGRLAWLTLDGVTVSGNAGRGISVGAAPAQGLTVVNSTISGNGLAGIEVDGLHPVLRLTHVTVTGNGTAGTGAGVFLKSCAAVELVSSLVAGNHAASAPDLEFGCGSVTASHTLIGSAAGHTAVSGALYLLTVDPLLGPLADNGGPTPTHALLAGSPAIDAGPRAALTHIPCVPRDQRGVVRPQGPACDVGAYEYAPTHEPEIAAIEQLQVGVAALGMETGLTTALQAKLSDAVAAVYQGDIAGACTALQDFMNQVKAQSGKKIRTPDAATLIDEAIRIRALLGC